MNMIFDVNGEILIPNQSRNYRHARWTVVATSTQILMLQDERTGPMCQKQVIKKLSQINLCNTIYAFQSCVTYVALFPKVMFERLRVTTQRVSKGARIVFVFLPVYF